MSQERWDAGTILRFLGSDGKKQHMGVAVSQSQVLELIAHPEGSRQVAHVYLTDANNIHPLTQRLPTWFPDDSPARNWSLEGCIDKVAKACRKYEGSDYDLIYKNCQHFAYEAATGRASSPDADEFSLLKKWATSSEQWATSHASLTSLSTSSQLSLKYRKQVLSLLNTFSHSSPEAKLAVSAFGSALDISEKANIFGSTKQTVSSNSYKINSLQQLRDAISKCNYVGICRAVENDFSEAEFVTQLDDGYYVYHFGHWLGGQHLFVTPISKSTDFYRSFNAIVERYHGALLGREEIFNILKRLR